MTNPLNTVLIQNIETFEHLIVLDIDGLSPESAFDAWMKANTFWGVVSFDADPDGEFGYIALVAAEAGPDFVIDEATGEMEAVETVDPALELEMKLDIAMEIDNTDEEFLLALETQDALKDAALGPWLKDVEEASTSTELKSFDTFLEDYEIAAFVKPVAFTPPTKNTTPAKGGKMKAHENLVSLIQSNPGISRPDVFQDPGLRVKLLSPGVMQKIANGDKLEVKRYNRRLNRFIRQMRRDGTDIQIERKGRVAHYTIGTPSGQLEIPFTPAAEARNFAITRSDAGDEDLEGAIPVEFTRANEDVNQNLSFEDLLSTLDNEAVAPVTK